MAVVADDATVAASRARRETLGFGPVVVVNPAGVVIGTLRREQLDLADTGAPVAGLVHFGVSTVRPSEQVADVVHRMRHARVTRTVITRSDAVLVGLFFTEDAPTVERDNAVRP